MMIASPGPEPDAGADAGASAGAGADGGSHADRQSAAEDSSRVPTLRTERLTLRGHTVADLDDCAAMWADAAVTQFISATPLTREDTWARLLRYAGHWTLMGFGFWAVRETATDRYLGDIGFADFRREIRPSLGDAPEMGWVLSAAAQGKGYATEAVQAALAWGEAHFSSSRTVCMIAPENRASLRVAEKCGYREFARTSYKAQTAILLERYRSSGDRAR